MTSNYRQIFIHKPIFLYKFVKSQDIVPFLEAKVRGLSFSEVFIVYHIADYAVLFSDFCEN